MEFPRVIAAPMAGGPSTPELVNAVSFGFIALGTCSVSQARSWLVACEAPFGANLFVPQPEPLPDDVHRTAHHLQQEVPALESDYAEKFAAVLEAAPAVVSSTFGCFTETEIAQLHAVGSEAWATVTNEAELREAQARGVDGVIIQGPRAGGHRGTWSQHDDPDQRSLPELLADLRPLATVPVIAAGGIRGPEDVAAIDVPVACGTAFLLADEAGTSQRNRELLRTDTPAVVSRAFSGRWASGVETDFTRENPDLPPTYPYLRPMTRNNDYCLVGADRGALMAAPAAEIERMLTP
ncbi:2-nitropropane dioxygenase [Corynebacterium sp. HMSC11D10]|uniref:NAD(P)H-dependent flavin oxidoreductase n=1 Tax=Corynebacterium sp. HMSC11D10 TaxID=1581088 RepID=UPI0008A14AA5|nr:nitronate monooxygenase [Corynebacterium sp. HMSC11D10]OFU55141.1 2-nitropropane dioxygenase [Corynebacterium sp. HMSC11D10]